MRKIKELTVKFDDEEELVLVGLGYFQDVRTTQRDEDHNETAVHYVVAQLTPEDS